MSDRGMTDWELVDFSAMSNPEFNKAKIQFNRDYAAIRIQRTVAIQKRDATGYYSNRDQWRDVNKTIALCERAQERFGNERRRRGIPVGKSRPVLNEQQFAEREARLLEHARDHMTWKRAFITVAKAGLPDAVFARLSQATTELVEARLEEARLGELVGARLAGSEMGDVDPRQRAGMALPRPRNAKGQFVKQSAP